MNGEHCRGVNLPFEPWMRRAKVQLAVKLVGRFLGSNNIPSRRVCGGCRCGIMLNKTLRLAPI